MKNSELVKYFYQVLINLDVSEIIICAGARNAPLVVGLDSYNFKVKSYFEERSAAFYALGRMKALKKPVVIITTSGTAVAELLPAVIEAYYQGLPLIVVSADRPKSYRGSGAPQSIEQVGIFNSYVSKCYDWDVFQTDLKIEFDVRRPLHLNLCFDEPLVDSGFADRSPTDQFVQIDPIVSFQASITEHVYSEELQKFINPLVIVGQLDSAQKIKLKKQLLKNQIFHYAESLSGLLGDNELSYLQINNLESLLGNLLEKNIFSSVIRIGGVPTLRFWRDLEKKFSDIPVLNIFDLSFSGLARKSLQADFSVLENVFKSISYQQVDLKNIQQNLQMNKADILMGHQNSEQNFIYGLSQVINNQPVYIGNSLPIREWDLFSRGPFENMYGNRGANGIDGQISTYLGWAGQWPTSWAVIGDLTAMYDLASLGLNPNDQPSQKRIVIINNQGGQIFKKVFNHDKFLNTHQIQFSDWAKMWGWDYLLVKNFSELKKITDTLKIIKNYIIEIQTDQNQSDAVWKQWETACQAVTF